jgi:hypothetical protein
MNLAELVAAYDNNDPVTACQMFQDIAKEHHGQCIAMEVCREFLITGLSLDGWNAMSDEFQWFQICISGWGRARNNTSASSQDFTISDAMAAASYAGNYFEHGFDTIVANAQPSITFTRTGGIE